MSYMEFKPEVLDKLASMLRAEGGLQYSQVIKLNMPELTGVSLDRILLLHLPPHPCTKGT